MNKKLLFLTLAAQLGSCKLTLGMQQEAFLQHSQLYSDTSSRLSSLPRDVSTIILALILPTVQYDPVRDRHLHWAPATGEGEPTPSPLHFAAYNGLAQLTIFISLRQVLENTGLILMERHHVTWLLRMLIMISLERS